MSKIYYRAEDGTYKPLPMIGGGSSILLEQIQSKVESVGERTEGTNTELSEVWAAISALQRMALEYPVLKDGATCFKTDTTGIYSTDITEIHFVDSYSPTGSEDASFNLDEGNTGSIKGYRTGTKIVVCGNGSGKIRLNPNSANLFGLCWALAELTGLEMLDASNVTNLSGAFAQCRSLREVDLSTWKIPNLTMMRGMFNSCFNLKRVVMPQYGIPANVNTLSAFAEDYSLKEVDFGRGLTSISELTFHRCHGLESVIGLGNVETVGKFAFVYAPSVKTDLNPKRIKTLGASAFRLSGVEDHADFSSVASVGLNATRSARWDADELAEIQAVKLPDTHIDVPNPDSIDLYPDIVYGYDDEGNELPISTTGCAAMTLYHIWNVKHAGTDKEYANFREWWESEINPTESPWVYDKNWHIYDIVDKLGWSRQEQITEIDASTKERIAQLLTAGEPVMVAMISSRPEGTTHTVAVIGSDSKTDKFEVLDSCNYEMPDATPWVSWLSFEDMFTRALQDDNNADGKADPPEFIYLINYNPQ